ncbi:type I glyceraldehyde-3-phosphate dehydrogenase [Candidatus Mycoplasma mahonii]|uniref:type I glyceraldehyde-3-phosphate dehydrogenase n=1 Tax=Candidatus Mycoplasma mahonii TaxID=3004105 RepID=UPI0026F2CE78|nr:type I glyceraldehyde-3-phosphate dehydrogenase [Candidatus Mycoplasma mahonii]WKX02701.1 type I glyceraldehyde-3-phosphate dehydrogenase [Candidatus Mycoplasma mahonii]
MKKIAINGFGRIGRLVFRQLIEDKNLKIVAINDLTDTKTLAHLLKYDTSQGRFNGTVEYTADSLVVNGVAIKVIAERDATMLPWKALEVEAVVEATGIYKTKNDASKHLQAGAKKVVISAPSSSADIKTIVFSVNEGTLTADDQIISAASCTTNALALVANVLENIFGIEKGFMTVVHAYTGDQKIQDAPHRDLRRTRAGAQNIIPTTTGAAVAIGKVLPELVGKLSAIAIRVPVITGSIVDLTVELKDKNASVKTINEAMKSAASSSFEYEVDPIVSSDIVGNTHGSIFDSLMTNEITVDGKKLFKVVTWFDNESSYVSQYVRTFKHFINL